MYLLGSNTVHEANPCNSSNFYFYFLFKSLCNVVMYVTFFSFY